MRLIFTKKTKYGLSNEKQKLLFVLFFVVMTFGFGNAQELPKWSDPVNISNLNSSEDDFAPSWNQFENLLYFNSSKSGYSKFYFAKYLGDGKFSDPELVPGDLNQPSNNQSYISFFSEEKAYLSSYRQGDYRSYMNIFQTTRKKKSWTKPLIADSLGYDTFVSQPTISPDGTFMVFVNTISSEHKDTDLWMAFPKDNGTWGAISPINELNTTGNEITPFLADKDTLYFSSDGQEGPGGFDIYYSVKKQGVWQKPIPVVEINSKFDESDFVILPTQEAIFSSDRLGTKGKLDLFIATKEKPQIKQEEYVPPAELSIASQVSAIRTNTELNYRLMPIIPVYFPEISNNHFMLSNEFAYSVIEPSIDSILIFSLPIIAKRTKEFKNSVLKIIPIYQDESQEDNITETARKISKYLIDDWSIPKDKISIIPPAQNKDFTYGNAEGSAIIFEADSSALFEPLSLGRSSVTLDPPVLDISVNARPAGIIKKWECNLFINNKYIKVIAQGNTLPGNFSVDLNPIKNDLTDADSLIINFTTTDTLNRTTYKSSMLNLAHSVNKSKEFKKIENKTYDDFYLFFIIDNLDKNMNHLKTSIEMISESGTYSKSVLISCFSKNLVKAGDELSAILTKNISDNRIKISTSLDEYKESLPFSKKYSENIIRIRIEKPIQN